MTEADSIVGIVAVDKSVNLMNASNDITMENVSLLFFCDFFVKRKKITTALPYIFKGNSLVSLDV